MAVDEGTHHDEPANPTRPRAGLLRAGLLQRQQRPVRPLRCASLWRLLHRRGMLLPAGHRDLLHACAVRPLLLTRMTPASALDPASIHAQFAHELRGFVASRVPDPADADDVLQDVFERVVRSAGGLRDPGALRAWLYRIVRNAIGDLRRRRGATPLDAEPAAPEPGPEDEAAAARCLVPLMAGLPAPAREALEAIELGGQPVRAAAEAAGVSEAAMKSRVQRARADLVDALTRCCAIEQDRRGGIASMSPHCSSNCGCRTP